MSTYKKLKANIISSMKLKDDKLVLLRSIDADIQLLSKETKVDINEDLVLDIITKACKQRNDSIDAYTKGNRIDLVNIEKKELNILKTYLPKQISILELNSRIDSCIERLGAKTIKDMGKVMGILVNETKNKASPKEISKIVRNKLK